MVREFGRAFPRETGGVLVGYWGTDSKAVVITDVVGPGPLAIHRENRFTPDSSYHEVEIARLYAQSNRLHTYLGDWHSHPDSYATLSRTDQTTLSRIAKHEQARIKTPLMAIIGAKNPPVLRIWQYGARGLFGSRVVSLPIRQFKSE